MPTLLPFIASLNWWDSMTAAEKFSSLGGLAGFLSFLAVVAIAWDSRRSASRQLAIAKAAADATRQAVDDQLGMSRRSRTASVRAARAFYSTPEVELEGMDEHIPYLASNGLTGIASISFTNNGMATAQDVQLDAAEYISKLPTVFCRDFRDESCPFASLPTIRYPAVAPGQFVDLMFGLRAPHSGKSEHESFVIEVNARYSDEFGDHRRRFNIQFLIPTTAGFTEGVITELSEPN